LRGVLWALALLAACGRKPVEAPVVLTLQLEAAPAAPAQVQAATPAAVDAVLPACPLRVSLFLPRTGSMAIAGALPATTPSGRDTLALGSVSSGDAGRLQNAILLAGAITAATHLITSPDWRLTVTGTQGLLGIAGRDAFRMMPGVTRTTDLAAFAVGATASALVNLGDVDGQNGDDFAALLFSDPYRVSIHALRDGHLVAQFELPPELGGLAAVRASGGFDASGDGRPDLLLASTTTGWWGIFEASGKIARSGRAANLNGALLVEDQDGDGRADVLLSRAANGGEVALLAGGSAEPLWSLSSAAAGSNLGGDALRAADVDGDGRSDWVLLGKAGAGSNATVVLAGPRIPLCVVARPHELALGALGRFTAEDAPQLALVENDTVGPRVSYFDLPLLGGRREPLGAGVWASMGDRPITAAMITAAVGRAPAGASAWRVRRAAESLLADVAVAAYATGRPGPVSLPNSPEAYRQVAVEAERARVAYAQGEGARQVLFYGVARGRDYDFTEPEKFKRVHNLLCTPSYNGRTLFWLFDVSQRIPIPESHSCDRVAFVPNRNNGIRHVVDRWGGALQRLRLADARRQQPSVFPRPAAGYLSPVFGSGAEGDLAFIYILAVSPPEPYDTLQLDRAALAAMRVRFAP
jgi:hypothetical protein